MICSQSEVFTDYLALTFPKEAENEPSPLDPIMAFLDSRYLLEKQYQKSLITMRLHALLSHDKYRYGKTSGLVHLSESKQFNRVSISGRMLAEIRGSGDYGELLNIMSSFPYNITRIDASLDCPTDASKVIHSLIKRYPKELNFTRKSLSTSWNLGTRPDGVVSGSFYAGMYSKARVSCIVYDKSKEAWDKRSEVLEPTTRYEMRFMKKDMGMTLRDAYNPASLFWAYAPVLGIEPGCDIPEWEPFGKYVQWAGKSIKRKSDAERLNELREFSPEVRHFLNLLSDKSDRDKLNYLLPPRRKDS